MRRALNSSVHEVRCGDGWRLSVEVMEPGAGEPPPRAVALLGHAMMVDRRTLDVGGEGLASELLSHGIAVVSADLRGHGRSGPLAREGGRWSYDDLVDQDTPALLAFARARYRDLRTFTVGHSLFGHVALAHLARVPDAPLDGAALLGVNVWLPRYEPDRRRWLVKRAILEASALAGNTLGYVPARRLRIGSTDESGPYFHQFRVWARSDEWSTIGGHSYRHGLRAIRKPILSIAGAGDRLLAHPESVRRFNADLATVEPLIAGRSAIATTGPGRRERHLPLDFDPGHMALVLDERCRPVWREIAEFVIANASDGAVARRRSMAGDARGG